MKKRGRFLENKKGRSKGIEKQKPKTAAEQVKSAAPQRVMIP